MMRVKLTMQTKVKGVDLIKFQDEQEGWTAQLRLTKP